MVSTTVNHKCGILIIKCYVNAIWFIYIKSYSLTDNLVIFNIDEQFRG